MATGLRGQPGVHAAACQASAWGTQPGAGAAAIPNHSTEESTVCQPEDQPLMTLAYSEQKQLILHATVPQVSTFGRSGHGSSDG